MKEKLKEKLRNYRVLGFIDITKDNKEITDINKSNFQKYNINNTKITKNFTK